MNTTTLKSDIHKLIDQIDNEQLLLEFYNEMKSLIQKNCVSAWDTLTDKQKKEILLSWEESEDEVNLVENDEVLRKYKDML
ncbi:MAG: hypothetical protein K0B37_13545 [Bacteroidales bacterium]|nr:hypothetical protein [Bacteroidales bacterium]